jgi:type I restriction enzyme S subunit
MTEATTWHTVSLGSVATLQRGFDLPTHKRTNGTVPVVSSSGVSGSHNKAMVAAPGVVTGRYGTIGQVFYLDRDFWPLNTTLWVSNFHGNDPLFTYYLLQRVDFATHSGKSGVPGVNRNDLHTEEMRIPPSRLEQHRIAAALLDADLLIAGLNRMIAKYRAIKQGIMQQLLTGSTRLPGFNDPWAKLRPLTQLCDKRSGFWGNDRPSQSTPIPVSVIRAGDITQDGRLSGHAKRYFSASELSRAGCKIGDVVITASGNGLGKTFFVHSAGGLAASNFVRILRPRTGLSGEFLAYVMQSSLAKQKLETHTATSAYPNLLPSFFQEPWLTTPSYEEQLAIASVLRSIDDEIGALITRFRKADNVRDGMMQELLTGRTRLPVVEAVA